MKIGIFYIISGILLIILSVVIQNNAQVEIEEVECFDKHNNEIKDLVCEEESYKLEILNLLLPLTAIMIFGLLIFGALGVGLSYDLRGQHE